MRHFKQRRLLGILVLAGLLLTATFILGACGGSSGGLKAYTDAKYHYSFQYPDGWEIEQGTSSDVSAGGSATDGVGVYNPDGAIAEDTYIDMAQVSVYELNVTVDESMMPEIKTEVESVLESLESQAGDLEILEPLAETNVNGMMGYAVSYTFDKNNAPVNSTLYFLFSGNIEYQITVQAATENWETNQPVFDALLKSFKPGTSE